MQLKEFFILEEDNVLFNQAITPPSCGGGEEFKFLALIGDKVIHLLLIEMFADQDITNTGILTPLLASMTDKDYFVQIAETLQISTYMSPIDTNYSISNKELCESFEALLGATYRAHGLEICQKVILSLIERFNFFKPDLHEFFDVNHLSQIHNPKGTLLELFQGDNLPPPNFQILRLGGEDHQPQFQCRINTQYREREYQITSEIFSSKKIAEKDAAQKLLEEILNQSI
ncbi:MAG: putative dsRNA-binding protein [Candidatus Hodarchaeales archaeon]|jgi:dsRNA-specific ribonuclease